MILYLVLDCNYLCHRHFSAMGQELSYNGQPTGMLFGFFRNLLELKDRFGSNRFIFCFDHGRSKRYQMIPSYKSDRQKRREKYTPEQKLIHSKMQEQIDLLRTVLLPELGLNNVFYQSGYEADDIIASVTSNMKKKREAVIVTADHDLYQMLSSRVHVYHPQQKKLIHKITFEKEWGISPSQWIDVKAMAGCKSDNIPGIPGVGERTACDFLTGKLKPISKKFETIVKSNNTWKKNIPFIQLPLPGTPVFKITKDNSPESILRQWKRLARKLGINSIHNPF